LSGNDCADPHPCPLAKNAPGEGIILAPLNNYLTTSWNIYTKIEDFIALRGSYPIYF
jgi:hypothetical protein